MASYTLSGPDCDCILLIIEMMIIGYLSQNGLMKSGGEYGPDPKRSLIPADLYLPWRQIATES